MSARMSTLARLRGRIERLESPCDAHALHKVLLGHAEADATLCGGLARAAVHEVFAEGYQGAAATGFIAGLAGRVTSRRCPGGFRNLVPPQHLRQVDEGVERLLG